MDMNQQQHPGHREQFKTAVNWLTYLSSALAASVEVFLHRPRTIGERYLGSQAGAVILIVPLFSMFWRDHDVMPLMQFLGLYLFMCFLVQVGIVARRRIGPLTQHSRYSGYPKICGLFRRLSERTAKMLVEPMLVFLAGIFFMPVSEPLGNYLVLASVGLLFSVQLTAGYERFRALDMHDAMIDQRQVAQRFRDLHGGQQ